MAEYQEENRTHSEQEKKRGVSAKLVFVIVAVALVGGFFVGSNQNQLVGAIGSAFGLKIATTDLDLSSVQSTYQALYKNYDGDLDKAKLIEGASRGLVEAVGDDYTVYMNQEEATEFENDLSGNIGGGIGAEIGLRNDQITVIRTLSGNPAEKAGLNAGDAIVSINDESTVGWSVDEAVQKIRGEVDTTVKLGILRNNELKEFTITRATITSPSVESEIKDSVGVLTIGRFDEQTGSLARKAAQNFVDQNVKAVVLDLRGNGGGYLSAAQDVAGLWLDNKTVVIEKSGGKVVDELKSGNNALLAGMPTVILVNASSASASEIVAGALQDQGAAKLVGEKTYGKGSVQKLVSLPESAKLKVTVASWYTPNGKNITKEGISPDVEAEITQEDINASRDPQYDAAIKLLGL